MKSKLVTDLGFRSKLEVIVNQQLVDAGVPFAYEGPLNTIRYEKPVTQHRYLNDFLLGNGIMIEAKGFFTPNDRKKHLLIQKQFPVLDVRFLFSNANNRLSKRSKTTYAAWCDKNGFKYAHKIVPQEWLDEIKPEEELDQIIFLLKDMNK